MIAKQDLLQTLKEVQKSPWHTFAICTNVLGRLSAQYQRNISQELEDTLESLFVKWPKYSGIPSYPVPSVTLGLTALAQFDTVALDKSSFWEGEYGELRKELLEFCIAQLENGSND